MKKQIVCAAAALLITSFLGTTAVVMSRPIHLATHVAAQASVSTAAHATQRSSSEQA